MAAEVVEEKEEAWVLDFFLYSFSLYAALRFATIPFMAPAWGHADARLEAASLNGAVFHGSV